MLLDTFHKEALVPSDKRFALISSRLENHGWELIRIKGSHHVFKGEGRPLISIPVHKGRVKAVYVRQVEAAIREIEREQGG